MGVEKNSDGREKGWRISNANDNYKLCSTYPQIISVPAAITDDMLRECADYRTRNRLPVLVWRSNATGAVLCRSSQPKVGLRMRECSADRELLNLLASSHNPKPGSSRQNLVIADCRPQVNAMANMVKGGFEQLDEKSSETWQLHFLFIENIHVMRESQLRLLRSLDALHTGTRTVQKADGMSGITEGVEPDDGEEELESLPKEGAELRESSESGDEKVKTSPSLGPEKAESSSDRNAPSSAAHVTVVDSRKGNFFDKFSSKKTPLVEMFSPNRRLSLGNGKANVPPPELSVAAADDDEKASMDLSLPRSLRGLMSLTANTLAQDSRRKCLYGSLRNGSHISGHYWRGQTSWSASSTAVRMFWYIVPTVGIEHPK
jgi:hypothetical protein